MIDADRIECNNHDIRICLNCTIWAELRTGLLAQALSHILPSFFPCVSLLCKEQGWVPAAIIISIIIITIRCHISWDRRELNGPKCVI